MSDIVLVGDSAGGAIEDTLASGVTIGGVAIALHGDAVAPHSPCPQQPAHCSATTTATSGIFIDNIEVVMDGDPATCGHAASASSGVTIS